jgi:peptidoglycan/LPS O-acetylase OafA/YrhL
MTMTSGTDGVSKRRHNLWRIVGWGAVAAALLAPAVAMRVGGDVDWTASDFLFAAVLLIGGGLLIELVVWKAKSRALRIALAIAVVAAVLVVWADGAVGIF